MREIKLYIACSLDNFIAKTDDGLDWLTEFPNPTNEDYSYNSFYNTIETLIMGGNTYRSIINMGVEWPYKAKTTYLISRTETNLPSYIFPLSENWLEDIARMKNEEGKDIWIVGGGEIISSLLNHNLIDEMIITYIPILLGNGIPLFPFIEQESTWKAIESICFKSGVVQTVFRRDK